MTPGTVVVFAQEADAPVDAVVQVLTERGASVFRADTSWFPERLVLEAQLEGSGEWVGGLRTDHRAVDLRDIRSIWYRDPSAFRFPDTLTDVERAYAHREARLGFGGVLAALPVASSELLWSRLESSPVGSRRAESPTWVNHPNRAADAVFKPLQLSTAAAYGLAVQPTLITNSPQAAAEFAARQGAGNTVCKSLGPNTITEGGELKVAFTRRLDEHDLADLSSVASTATQLQRWVDKSHEARIVVVGEQLFTVLIDAGSDASRVDWRADFDALSYRWVDTPPEIIKPIGAYMEDLGLAYAALDFAIESGTGRWIFLESNSSGQYGWLESRTGAPITAALADLLTQGARS